MCVCEWVCFCYPVWFSLLTVSIPFFYAHKQKICTSQHLAHCTQVLCTPSITMENRQTIFHFETTTNRSFNLNINLFACRFSCVYRKLAFFPLSLSPSLSVHRLRKSHIGFSVFSASNHKLVTITTTTSITEKYHTHTKNYSAQRMNINKNVFIARLHQKKKRFYGCT